MTKENRLADSELEKLFGGDDMPSIGVARFVALNNPPCGVCRFDALQNPPKGAYLGGDGGAGVPVPDEE